MSVVLELTTAMQMHYVPIMTDYSLVHVKMDMKEMAPSVRILMNVHKVSIAAIHKLYV